MAKLTLNSITSNYGSQALLNANSALIEAALEKTLSRDGTSPNQMEADFDMNGFNIANVGTITANDVIVDGSSVGDSAAAAAASAAAAATSETNAAASAASAAADAATVEGAKLIWRGAWSGVTDYVVNDAVSNSGSSYICTAPNTNQAPPNASYWDLLAQQGTAGTGTGDMLAANNLSDVANAATSFNAIKQAATTSSTGVVELATDAETQALADTGRAVTPSNLGALLASESQKGIVEFATQTEFFAGTDSLAITAPDINKLMGRLVGSTVTGFIMSNSLTDASNDIVISAGACMSFDDGAGSKVYLYRDSAITKRLDATWAAGNNAGGMWTGQTKTSLDAFYMYAVANADGSACDFIFSKTTKTASDLRSEYAATFPTGHLRLVGFCSSMISSSALNSFHMQVMGDARLILWLSPRTTIFSVSTTKSTLLFSNTHVPSLSNKQVLLDIRVAGDVILSHPDVTIPALGSTNGMSSNNPGNFVMVPTDTNGIAARGASAFTMYANVAGFVWTPTFE